VPPAGPATPFISSASVTTTPVKPISRRSRSNIAARDSVAGRSPVSTGTRMCAVITAWVPALMAAANGARSRSRNSSMGTSTVGSSRCESELVAPWPGKCLAQAATPTDWRPVIAAAAWAATFGASAPKARVPMMGFSSVVLTSMVGARFRLNPAASRSSPIAR